REVRGGAEVAEALDHRAAASETAGTRAAGVSIARLILRKRTVSATSWTRTMAAPAAADAATQASDPGRRSAFEASSPTPEKKRTKAFREAPAASGNPVERNAAR